MKSSGDKKRAAVKSNSTRKNRKRNIIDAMFEGLDPNPKAKAAVKEATKKKAELKEGFANARKELSKLDKADWESKFKKEMKKQKAKK